MTFICDFITNSLNSFNLVIGEKFTALEEEIWRNEKLYFLKFFINFLVVTNGLETLKTSLWLIMYWINLFRLVTIVINVENSWSYSTKAIKVLRHGIINSSSNIFYYYTYHIVKKELLEKFLGVKVESKVGNERSFKKNHNFGKRLLNNISKSFPVYF